MGTAFEIINSYAIGSVAGTGANKGGLVGGTIAGITNSSYWNSETSSQSESRGGTSKTTVELQTSVANTRTDTTYYQWDTEHWYFGTAEQYPAAVYADDDDIVLCREPSEAQLASCASRVSVGLNAANRAIICRDRLRQSDEEQPYCGALVPGQHLGLIDLELSDGVRLEPAFSPEVEHYRLVVDNGQTEFWTMPTAYHRSDTVTIKASNLEQLIDDNTRGPTLNIADYDVVTLAVHDATTDAEREYELIIRGLVPPGVIAISYIEDLEQLRNPPTRCTSLFRGCTYSLTRHLDFNDPQSYRSGVVDPRWTSGSGWQPISRFTGTLNGNGYTISNLMINRPNADHIAFFHNIFRTRIENIALLDVNINGRQHVASLVVVADRSEIVNSYATGNVSGHTRIGGLIVDQDFLSHIINSYTNVSVEASFDTNSNTSSNDVDAIGGLVAANSLTLIGNSYALGTVRGGGEAIGGLIGSGVSAIIRNSYASGDVRGGQRVPKPREPAQIGGFGGSINSIYSIAKSYSTGQVSIDRVHANANAFIRCSSRHNFLGNYWDADTTGITGQDSCSTGVTTAQLQNPISNTGIYSGSANETWSLDDWDFGTSSQYPAVKYTAATDVLLRPACRDASDTTSRLPPCGALVVGQRGLFSLDQLVRLIPGNIITDRDVAVDTDGNGLIEISSLEQLYAMRYRPDGKAYKASERDISNATGCPDSGCSGYELTLDLDFTNPGSYDTGVVNPDWIGGAGWEPIGNAADPFVSNFIADGHTISNLLIRRNDTDAVGFFGVTNRATIRGLGVHNAEVIGGKNVESAGILIGEDKGNSSIINSYAIGTVRSSNDLAAAGGLAGEYLGNIVNSYAYASVFAKNYAGGLVGKLRNGNISKSYAAGRVGSRSAGGLVGWTIDSTIDDSYASNAISGTRGGGLVALIAIDSKTSTLINNSYAIGANNADISYGLAQYADRFAEHLPGRTGVAANTTASYWGQASGVGVVDGAIITYPDQPAPDIAGEFKFTTDLQSPVSNTGIYSAWSNSDWNFGTATQYPMLKYTSSTDIVTHPACREADDTSSSLPVCGNALPNQYINLQDLAFSNEVLQISPPFNPVIHEYQLTLKAGAMQFHTTPTSINAATYQIRNADTNSEILVMSGNASSPIAVTANGSNTIAIHEILPGSARGTTYTLIVTHHPYLVNNVDVDADDDGLIEVRNIRDLNAMRYQLDGSGARASTASNKITTGCLPASGCIGYELAADIDLAGIAWQPIGAGDDSDIDSGIHFGAIFDGNRDLGYEISKLTINALDAESIGLFAYLESTAEVRNLALLDIAIDGIANIGGVAGHSKGAIANSRVAGSLSGNADVGALAGKNDGFIGSSIADVTVSGSSSAGNESRNIGGLVGHNTGQIVNSGVLANIRGNTNVGALVGINDSSNRRDARIVNSYAGGHVSGDSAIGGLVGRNASFATIRNSYGAGEVAGRIAAGGLVGLNFGTLANTYASGIIAAGEQGGGLVGNNRNARDAVVNSYAISRVRGLRDSGALIGLGSKGVNNSYWDSSTSGQLRSAGGIGKSTAELQNPTMNIGIYSTWSDSDWDFGTSSEYPQLKYAPGDDSDRPACGDAGLPNCGDVQVHGLTNLEVAGLAVSPQFEPSRLHYTVAAELGVVSSLRIIAHAADSNAMITIAYKEQRITAESEVPSEPIMLDLTTSEAIRIKVQSIRDIVEYMLELDYLSSGLNRLADADGNGLIEITTLEDLNAMRHSLAGTVYRRQQPDGTFTQTVAGCPTTATVTACSGYELSRDLDFADAASYRSGLVNSDWMNRWDPIGGVFNANFNGNGYTLRNLHINGVATKDGAGLFHTIGAAGRVENLNIRNLTIEGLAGDEKVGGVAGENRGLIFNTRIINANIKGTGSETLSTAVIGSLVGLNDGSDANVGNIEYSSVYGASFVSTNHNGRVGVLVGINQNGAEIHNSYVVSNGFSNCVAGGLVGEQSTADRTNPDDISTIRNSYAVTRWNIVRTLEIEGCIFANTGGMVAVNDNSDIMNSYALFETQVSGTGATNVGSFIETSTGTSVVTNSYWNYDLYELNSGAGSPQNTVALQTPTTATGIYVAWSEDDWDFGTSTQYPTLRAADGSTATEVWDTSLLTDITVENAAIIEDFAPLKFKYRLLVDSIQPPPQIAFNVSSTRSDVSIEIYCDEVRCPLADPADPTTILFATTDLEEIRIVARQSNRVAEYYYTVIYDEYTLTNVDGISVDEGGRFNIELNYPGAFINIDDFIWEQIAGPLIDSTHTIISSSSIATLVVRSDLVPKAADHSIIKFSVKGYYNRQVYITREISLRINKVNNGNNVTVTLSRQGMQLRVVSTIRTDPDGGSAVASNIIIQRRLNSEYAWAIVSSNNSNSYNLPAETSDYQYRAIHIYEDGQAYLESIASNIITISGGGISATDTDGDSVLNADDIDDDNDGLIEIHYLEELDAIRYQLDGSGYRASTNAELITSGCPISGCIGYELMGDLDFNDAASYRAGVVNTDWTVSNFSDANDFSWQPIDGTGPFNAIFKGNGYKIINLQINRSVGTKSDIALFARIGSSGRVEGLGLIDPLIGGLETSSSVNKRVGGIVGNLYRGVIVNSYVISRTPSLSYIHGSKNGVIGGMVGLNSGYILNSYTNINVQDTNASVSKSNTVGGMVGQNSDGGKIHNSYVAGDVKGGCTVGGLAGIQFTIRANTLESTSEIRNSYVSGEVATGFGTCSADNNKIVGGITGKNIKSIIENTYISGAIRKQTGAGNCLPSNSQAALAGGNPTVDDTILRPVYSYWNSQYEAACSISITNPSSWHLYWMSRETGARRVGKLQGPTGPDVMSNDCYGFIDDAVVTNIICTSYEGWSEDDWHFGTASEYPTVKYAIGLDRENPGCGFGVAGLPQCGSLVGSQSSAATVPPLDPPQVTTLPQARIRYALNGSAFVALGARDTIDMDEGDTLILDAANSFTEDDIVLAYSWKQMSGPTLLPQPRPAAAYTVEVGEDFLSVDTNSAEVVLRLEITEKGKSDMLVAVDVTAAITKTNSDGKIRINLVDEPLLIASEINDADGGPLSNINYQWQQEIGNSFVDINDANQASYRRTAGNQNILLLTTYTDGQGYSNNIITLAPLRSTIVDQDGDGLIEIASIEQLSAMRHQQDGSGYKASASATLNSEGCPSSGCNGYELVRDLDFNDPDSYSTSTGVLIRNWNSIGNFTAIFEGNGFTISNLRVNNPTSNRLGLFAMASGNAEIRRVRLANVNITGDAIIGALVGESSGSKIIDCHVISGRVHGTLGTSGCLVAISNTEITDSSANCRIEGEIDVGGLVGMTSKRIHNSFASGDVIGLASTPGVNVGGLVGRSSSSISDSYATGNVSGSSNVGGLAGRSTGAINNSYATGSVSGSSNVGSLAGRSTGAINNSYATGSVSGSSNVGGLAGRSTGTINNSYATGTVEGNQQVGGLVGQNRGQISNSHATGTVQSRPGQSNVSHIGGLTGYMAAGNVNNSFALGNISGSANRVGGLIGFLENGRISDSYAIGTVQGNSNIGGLVGELNAEISDSYAIGTVRGNSNVGGLLASTQTSAIVHRSYWSTDSNTSSTSSILGVGYSSEVLKSAVSGTNTQLPYLNWSNDNWDFGTAQQYPIIKYNDATCDGATPSENCGKLLPRQRPGLLDIVLSQIGGLEQPQLSPEFNTTKTEYTAYINSNAIETKITMIAANPNSLISINNGAASVGPTEYFLSPNFSMATMLKVQVAEPNALAGEVFEYSLSFNRFPIVSSIERQVAENEQSAPLAASALIREGHFITLSSELSDADGDDLSYQWIVDDTQVSVLDRSRLAGSMVGGAGSASLSFYLLEDLIASDQSTTSVRASLMLRDANNMSIALREIEFLVRKHDNGTIGAISALTQVNLTYIVPAIDVAKLAEDPDGAGALSSIRYQWQQQNEGVWSDIAGATARSYTIGSLIPEYYRVIVGYTDGQAYENERVSAAEPASLDVIIKRVPAAETEGFTELHLSADGLSPDFSRETNNYEVPVKTDTLSVVAIAKSGEISINGMPIGGPSRSVRLKFGNNTIRVVWTNGTITETYEATVFRVYDLSLKSLSLAWDGVSLSKDDLPQGSSAMPSYEPAKGMPNNRIPNHIDTVSVTVKLNVGAAAGVNIAISLGNTAATVSTSTEADLLVAQATISGLVLRENIINIRVSPPVGDDVDYAIKLDRRYNPRLTGLNIASTPLTPAIFDPERLEYNATISNDIEMGTVTINRNPGTSVFINPESNDLFSGSNSLAAATTINYPKVGLNTIVIRVTAPGEDPTDYTLLVNREYSLDVRDLAVSDPDNIAISPSFSTMTSNYVAMVSDTTEQLTIAFSTDLDVSVEIEANTTPTVTSMDITGVNGKKNVTATVPLNFDENPIKIKVSVVDEESVTILTVVRMRGSNANLKQPDGLSVSVGELSYDETNRVYRVEVEDDVDSILVTLRPQDPNIARISLDGISLNLGNLKQTGSFSTAISGLAEGANSKALVITAHDGETRQEYELIVNRALSSDDRLLGLQIFLFAGDTSSRIVQPASFDTEVLSYTLPNVEYEINRIKVIPLASNSSVMIEVRKSGRNYSTVVNGAQSDFINLSLGANVIEIKVTSLDMMAPQVYTVNINRKLSTNIELSEAPKVASKLSTRVEGNNYVARIDEGTLRFTVAATAVHSSATVTISGGVGEDAIGSPTASKSGVSINSETREPVRMTITVLAQDRASSQTYTLTIGFEQNLDTSLSSLTVSPRLGELTVQEKQYAASIGEATSKTTVTATATNSNATVMITIDGETIQSTGSVSRQITIAETGGSKELRIRVRAEDGTLGEEYTLTINRDQSSNAQLTKITVEGGELMQDSKDTTRYTATIGEHTMNTTVTVSAHHPQALVTIKEVGSSDVSGTASANKQISITETGGSKTLSIVVTAQNKITTKSYIVQLTRALSSDADLKDLQLLRTNREPLQVVAGSDDLSYSVEAPNIVTTVTVVATAHEKAIIELILDGASSTDTGVIRGELGLDPNDPSAITKQIGIVITSQDKDTTRAYTVTVTRARQDSSSAGLASIGLWVLADGSSIPIPAAMQVVDTAEYRAAIGDIGELEVQEIERIRVSPRAADSGATISVDGRSAMPNPSLNFSLSAALDMPERAIPIKVIAENGISSQTYTLVITRVSSSDTRLSLLEVGTEALAIGVGQENYKVNIGEHTTNTTVMVTAKHSRALVTISGGGGADVVGGRSASKRISLATGESQALSITVLAQDQASSQTYTLTVTRARSTNAQLDDITVGGFAATAVSATTFTAAVRNYVAMPTVVATAHHPQATVTISGGGGSDVIGSRRVSKRISLATGESKVLSIVVTAQDMSVRQAYALTVTRAKSNDADLSKLELLLQPSGDAIVIFNRVSSTQSYAISLDSVVTSIRVKATANDEHVNKIEVFAPGSASGEQIASGEESSIIDLTVGKAANIKIVLSSQDETTTRGYTITVTRALSSDAELSALVVTPGLMQSFAPDHFNYEVSENIREKLLLTVGSKANQAVTVMLNNDSPESLIAFDSELRIASESFNLDYGENRITITVTAQDETKQIYIVTADRSVILDSLILTGLKSDDSYAFDPDITRYEVTVDNNSPSLDLDPAVSDSSVSYTISEGDNEIMQDKLGDASIPFNLGEMKTITIEMKARNETTNHYVLQATREISSDADLSTLQLLPAKLDISFMPAQNEYSVRISNPVVGAKTTSVELEATVNHSSATITTFTINGAAATGISDDRTEIDADIPIAEGETKSIVIEVIAQDEMTTKSYTVMLTRSQNADTRLSTLTTQPGGTPQGFVFDPASNAQATRYSVELPSDMASTTVTATANNAHAMLTIRESTGSVAAPSPSASLPVRIGEGEHKEIIIVVTAQSATTQTYRVIISRASAIDKNTLGFEVELTGVSFISSDTSSYIGELINANTERTVASASVDIAGVSVQHIWVDDNTKTDYILGDTVQNLTADSDLAIISKSIPVERRGTKITLVLRRTDNTADGYTEEDYIITIEASALRIRAKVFLEGPLQ